MQDSVETQQADYWSPPWTMDLWAFLASPKNLIIKSFISCEWSAKLSCTNQMALPRKNSFTANCWINGGRLCVGIRLDMGNNRLIKRADDGRRPVFWYLTIAKRIAIAGQIIAKSAIRSDKPTANLTDEYLSLYIQEGRLGTRISLGVA